MLDIHFIIKNKNIVIDGLNKRCFKNIDIIDKIILLYNNKKNVKLKLDNLLMKSNIISKNIGKKLIFDKEKKKKELNFLINDSLNIKNNIKNLKKILLNIENDLRSYLIQLPNIPDKDINKGNKEKYNNEIYRYENIINIKSNVISHLEISKNNKIFDFDAGVKITGSGFPIYLDKGAKIQRALINFFLEKNISAGYTEYVLPYLVNENSVYATGQIPDKENQMYYLSKDSLYLIPTGEVPLLNYYKNNIFSYKDLPIKSTTYTACFRREAGSYGIDNKGLNRIHQFDKVEIIQITKYENSYKMLLQMIDHVKNILISLNLPFRIIKLCAGNMSNSSSMTYDFEVYNFFQKKWLEVSSISNCLDFQSRRLMLRYRMDNGKINYCHTLNGSSLAIPRILITILENNQKNNKIHMPNVLIPYLGFDTILI